ncbi:MAG: hypothetical protein B7Z10_05030 [Rhodobacterales bacterium 32-66-7]|nr:MAG: hypothetical protein B7Z10_05030 [Rhodobacterales bacterium 32-66-7]
MTKMMRLMACLAVSPQVLATAAFAGVQGVEPESGGNNGLVLFMVVAAVVIAANVIGKPKVDTTETKEDE